MQSACVRTISICTYCQVYASKETKRFSRKYPQSVWVGGDVSEGRVQDKIFFSGRYAVCSQPASPIAYCTSLAFQFLFYERVLEYVLSTSWVRILLLLVGTCLVSCRVSTVMQLLCAPKHPYDNSSGRKRVRSIASENATSLAWYMQPPDLPSTGTIRTCDWLIPVIFFRLPEFRCSAALFIPAPWKPRLMACSRIPPRDSAILWVKLLLNCEFRFSCPCFASQAYKSQASKSYETPLLQLAVWISTKKFGRLHTLLDLRARRELPASTLAPDGDRIESAIFLKALALW